MDDKVLLRRAAKAAGYEVRAANYESPDLLLIRLDPNYSWMPFHEWNPLDDDGDALRLAVKLGLEVYHSMNDNRWTVFVGYPKDQRIVYMMEVYEDDPYAATRRAIVRAAAALGGDDA